MVEKATERKSRVDERRRENLDDVPAFLAVARERSFTRAAAKLGVPRSALSHTIRGLEARPGLRLPARTTRSIAPTEAGERLPEAPAPRFDEIEAEFAGLSELRDKPAGTIRITAGEQVVKDIEGRSWHFFRPCADFCDLT